jgi:hypothetical protein
MLRPYFGTVLRLHHPARAVKFWMINWVSDVTGGGFVGVHPAAGCNCSDWLLMPVKAVTSELMTSAIPADSYFLSFTLNYLLWSSDMGDALKQQSNED